MREVADDVSSAGFKKNVNRATTQVMMKTGEFVECYPATRLEACGRLDRGHYARAIGLHWDRLNGRLMAGAG
jgi:adenylylsulfate kinase-like enzyme